MTVLTVSVLESLSVATAMVFERVPLVAATLTLIPICPFVPGATTHGNGGNWAVVQPQDGWTLNMVMLLDETLVKLKVKCATFSPAMMFVAFVSESQIRFVFDNDAAAVSGVADSRKQMLVMATRQTKVRKDLILYW